MQRKSHCLHHREELKAYTAYKTLRLIARSLAASYWEDNCHNSNRVYPGQKGFGIPVYSLCPQSWPIKTTSRTQAQECE